MRVCRFGHATPVQPRDAARRIHKTTIATTKRVDGAPASQGRPIYGQPRRYSFPPSASASYALPVVGGHSRGRHRRPDRRLGVRLRTGLKAYALPFVLALATVGGAVAAEYVRRSGAGVERPTLGDAWQALATNRGALVDVLSEFGLRRPAAGRTSSNESHLLVVGVASLFLLVGLVPVTERLLVVPLVVASLAGVTMIDYAYRRTRALETSGGGRRRERAREYPPRGRSHRQFPGRSDGPS